MLHKNRLILTVCGALLPCALSIQSAYAHYEDAKEKQESDRKLQESRNSILPNYDPWKLLEAALQPAYAANLVHIDIEGVYRVIKSNGLPNHNTGAFPNAGNPNTIREQDYTFRMPADPKYGSATTALGMYPFGVAVNGVPFDPGAAEWWNNDPSSGWQYEAMALGPRLGIDQNNAHVQPNGAYHYHGLPTGLLDKLASSPKPVLLGYAADGFPIYAPFSYSDPMKTNSPLKKLKASFRLKGGSRPNGPGGSYDGSFVQDYEYKSGWGDLDDCNGRYGVTSEYPRGTYYYVITDAYPYIPRGFKGTPDQSFKTRGGSRPMPPGGGFGPPGGRGFGPPGGGGFGPPGGRGLGPPGQGGLPPLELPPGDSTPIEKFYPPYGTD